ncbi:uncharacterized protein LOC136069658 [Quercus suber]|uniref:uncharacterized protein LOC136069658 n=1 Tax=Quercus suber TaxID=58331 RepID=UPI0032E010FB
MHVDVSISIIYCETAGEMWLELQHVFSQGNGPKVYDLQREISHISQNHMSVTEYYTKFKQLWDQLLNFDPLPECSYGAMKILSASHEKAYVMRFLMGLNENYGTLRSQILMLEPFPSMSRVYSLVLQEESHKHIGHGVAASSQSDTMTMYTNSKGNCNSNWNKGNGKKKRPFCTHCNMQGHTIDKCYKLHGYPPGYKPKGKSGANQVSCSSVNGADKPMVATTQCPISKAQCEQLLAYLNSGNIYSGATLGDVSHVASVSSYCTFAGVEGMSNMTSDMVGTSA